MSRWSASIRTACCTLCPRSPTWVCSEELMHAHAMAGFFRQLMALEDDRVHEIMQRWGLYYRSRPLADPLVEE